MPSLSREPRNENLHRGGVFLAEELYETGVLSFVIRWAMDTLYLGGNGKPGRFRVPIVAGRGAGVPRAGVPSFQLTLDELE
jgi:hypothetical protein